ncbi:MAG TPA: glycosyltransferase family 4 protein [Actinomycetota bacterium]|nr:glycosyltransferase family 4 protein [Actinomycetota bacterium]
MDEAFTVKRRVTFVVPGGVDADTGGNVYDRAAMSALATRGWDIVVVETAEATDSDVVVVDSLAMPAGMPSTRAPVVALVHQLPSEAAGLEPSAGEVAVLRAASRVVTVSEWLAGRLRRLGAGSIGVVRPGRDRAWASEGPRADASTVLCVANAYPGKGLAEAVEAFSNTGLPAITLRIAGDLGVDHDEASRVRAALERSAARVELLGVVPPPALSIAYGEALVLIVASRYEGWPIAVAEAMASGVPVVGFDVPGVAELVRDGIDGVLAPVGDIDALSRATAAVCGDARLRARLGAAARARALGWPTWEESGERFAEEIERLAAQESGAP